MFPVLMNLNIMPTYFGPLVKQTEGGRKSTALQPLQWAFGILLTGLAAGSFAGLPTWALTLIGVILGLIAVLYVVAYIYFMLRNPDALRSEAFTIAKMAIQHGVVGDSLVGEFSEERLVQLPPTASRSSAALPTGSNESGNAGEDPE